MWMTWKHEDADFGASFTFEQKVEVFYEQTLGWQLHIADLVANGGTTFGELKDGKGGERRSEHSSFRVCGAAHLLQLHRIDRLSHADNTPGVATLREGMAEIVLLE